MIFKQALIILTFIYCFWQNTPSNLPKDHVLDKYYENWKKIKKILNIKFHSIPVYDEKYIKAKVKEFNDVIKTNFLGDEIPTENVHYACIACIAIDSVMGMEKKNYPQVYKNANTK